ncbi:protein translocase subunit SecD [Citricoccus sp. SGAir0253]|uniref:protein translocase subunit SecD n=1 Tax=Citricoccus sp. SGAir0253 TaxID=2567881 RepID=UPI0010CD6B11|nr:protein translocase subunit SecD [Citricoccus sp. SGAir0253]QCU77904.1 protein translocase subunit SecD [Citricoccus sp. SGAir0253]
MSDKTPRGRARRTLWWLTALVALLAAILGVGIATGQAHWAPKLALDLEGGTQMVLAPEVSGDQQVTPDQLDQAVEIIRQRVDGSGVAEAEIATQGGRNVVVSLPGVPDPATRDLIQASANMEFRPVITAGPYEAVPKDQRTPTKDFPKPTAEPENGSDPNWITPQLAAEFEAYDCAAQAREQDREDLPADKPAIACQPGDEETGQPGVKYILGPVEVQGTDIAGADYGLVNTATGVSTNQWAVNLTFNGQGSDAFREVTQRLTPFPEGDPRKQFAIVLDGTVVSAPQSNAVITDGRAQITGNFSEQSAAALAEQLKYGALPISFSIESEQQISATLGADQLRLGLVAGLIGLGLVAVYSFFQYRLLGLVTIASLVVAGALTYLAIVLLGWSDNYRLSLAGIAGLIVAIGLTADSFIVYFERIKDELRHGRTLPEAVEYGWARAKRTVTASKAVNLLAAVVLYFVAVGNVRGFAFTLGLTAIADLVVVFLFTHPVMQLLAHTRFFGGGHRLSGLDPSLLGREPLYQGAGRIREFRPAAARTAAAPAPRRAQRSAKEAARRQTIAERRRAERLAAVGTPTDPGTPPADTTEEQK